MQIPELPSYPDDNEPKNYILDRLKEELSKKARREAPASSQQKIDGFNQGIELAEASIEDLILDIKKGVA